MNKGYIINLGKITRLQTEALYYVGIYCCSCFATTTIRESATRFTEKDAKKLLAKSIFCKTLKSENKDLIDCGMIPFSPTIEKL